MGHLAISTLRLGRLLGVWKLVAPPPIVSTTGVLLAPNFPPFSPNCRALSLWLGHMTVPFWFVSVLYHPRIDDLPPSHVILALKSSRRSRIAELSPRAGFLAL